MRRFILATTTLLVATFALLGAAHAAPQALPEGSIVVIGPFPLDEVPAELREEAMVIDMAPPVRLHIGFFEIDRETGECWIDGAAPGLVELDPMLIEVAIPRS
ncbi:MAG: hypothetical protein KC635_19430 [Myxococcales bacterium]|nr:hypothetical protein [Myxococcales bacterium]MCB9731705.1 hypothetical protein [Deltaproteobacteria bacterium]